MRENDVQNNGDRGRSEQKLDGIRKQKRFGLGNVFENQRRKQMGIETQTEDTDDTGEDTSGEHGHPT